MEQIGEKRDLFENESVPRAVIHLAVPTVLSSLVTVLYNLADTFYVSMLDDPIQNAAVTMAAPVMLAFSAVINLFGVGCSSVMSRAMGSRRETLARQSAALGVWFSLLCGVLFSLAYLLLREPLLQVLGADASTAAPTMAYMEWTVAFGAAPSITHVVVAYLIRAEGDALHASVGTMSGCILNVILDPFFVLPWGLGMGAAGAGLATFLSNCAACLYFLVYLYRKRRTTLVSLHPGRLSLRRSLIRSVFQVGIPAAIQNLLNVTGMTIMNNLVHAYGATAVAAMGICEKIHTVPVDMAMGFTQGILPLISYNYASDNRERMKQVILFSGKLLTAVMVVIAAVVFLFPGFFVGLFMEDGQVLHYGIRYLRGMALVLPFLRLDFFTVGIFQAVGMGRETLLFALLRKLALEIPALFVLNALFPPYGLAYAQLTAEIVLSAVSLVMLRKFFRNLEGQMRKGA